MNWDQIEGNWKQFKGKIKEKWGKLTDDDLDNVAGRQTELKGSCRSGTASRARKPPRRSTTG